MTLTAPPTLGVRPSAARTATLWAFRCVALVQAVAFVLQPMSIGSFLQGNWGAFTLHQAVGGILVMWTAITAAAGLALALLARRVWLALGVVVLCVLTTVQVALGSSGLVSVHIPLGVALVGVAVWMSAWSWTRAARWA